MICEAWDIAVVPFPFTDGPETKRRPAAVLSSAGFNKESGHSIMAMITSARQSAWPGDVLLPPASTGLAEQCFLRMKLFTLDNRLILRVIGKLAAKERQKARAALQQALGGWQ